MKLQGFVLKEGTEISGLYHLDVRLLGSFYDFHQNAMDVMKPGGRKPSKFFKKYRVECADLGIKWVCKKGVAALITVQAVGMFVLCFLLIIIKCCNFVRTPVLGHFFKDSENVLPKMKMQLLLPFNGSVQFRAIGWHPKKNSFSDPDRAHETPNNCEF
jgi:hypothetical protein